MSTMKEMLEDRRKLAEELGQMDSRLKEMTDTPADWEIDSGHGHIAGGVTLHGTNYDADGRTECVSICVYSGGVIITDGDGDRSATVDREAMRAALKIFDIKKEESKAERERLRAERASKL